LSLKEKPMHTTRRSLILSPALLASPALKTTM
jgi:hypothetical protein